MMLSIECLRALFLIKRMTFFVRHVLFSGVRMVNLVAYLLGSRRHQNLKYLPFKLDVEPTTHCNFACAMCHVSDPAWVGNHMQLEQFISLIDSSPQVFRIKLQGMGEPLLNKEFFSMARYSRERGLYVSTTTNGSTLNKQNIKSLLSSNSFGEVIVSIDGATKATFEAVRHKSDFHRVVDNVQELFKQRSLVPIGMRPFVFAWTVIQEANFSERFQIIDLAADLGFDKLTFQTTISTWGKEEWGSNKSKQIVIDKKEASRLAAYARRRGLWFNIYRDNLIPRGTPCSWPFESAYVGARMDVVPCCSIADPRLYNLGRITDGSGLNLIWQNNDYKKLRQMHLSGRIPECCEQCYER
jgi:MoaA/NifB/PqqE/SkfB family radical SAM enzyme